MRWFKSLSWPRRVIYPILFVLGAIYLIGKIMGVFVDWASLGILLLLAVLAVLAYRDWSHAPTRRDD